MVIAKHTVNELVIDLITLRRSCGMCCGRNGLHLDSIAAGRQAQQLRKMDFEVTDLRETSRRSKALIRIAKDSTVLIRFACENCGWLENFQGKLQKFIFAAIGLILPSNSCYTVQLFLILVRFHFFWTALTVYFFINGIYVDVQKDMDVRGENENNSRRTRSVQTFLQ